MEKRFLNFKEKCLIPLINNKLSSNDTSKSIGFAGIYFGDKNKPYIENCMFLLYKLDNSIEQYDLVNKFKTFNNLYTTYILKVNNIYYRVFVFTINYANKNDINSIKNGYLNNISLLNKYRISNYYSSDSDLFCKLFINNKTNDALYDLPEEDYKVSILDHFHIYAESPIV